MRKIATILGLLLLVSGAAGCKGIRSTEKGFVAHAETFRIFTFPVMGDDLANAWSEVPPSGKVTNVSASAADMKSLFGILNNIFGITVTQIGGTLD
jgi:hypothetical protein